MYIFIYTVSCVDIVVCIYVESCVYVYIYVVLCIHIYMYCMYVLYISCVCVCDIILYCVWCLSVHHYIVDAVHSVIMCIYICVCKWREKESLYLYIYSLLMLVDVVNPMPWIPHWKWIFSTPCVANYVNPQYCQFLMCAIYIWIHSIYSSSYAYKV